MSKVAIIFWSGTGNTEMMANAIADGAKEAGAEVSLLPVSATSADQAAGFDRLALGCPAMGAEVLEEMEFEPFFAELESKLSGKRVALFGSFGWGDGQWMRDWYSRTDEAGAVMVGEEGLMAHELPTSEVLDRCKALGKELAG
ncbi:MAG: flavodoxin [Butyricicoccus pullicaecorum]|nr:flavodoxin [Butyricicoccus pullicaecorum]